MDSVDISDKNWEISSVPAHLMPLRCHYDKDTVLASHCELVKVIEIRGGESEEHDERMMIRKAIEALLSSYDIVVNIYTVRDYDDISIHGNFSTEALAALDKLWNDANAWQKRLSNKLYVSFTYLGGRKLLTESNIFQRVAGFFMQRSMKKVLKEGNDKLNRYVSQFCSMLSEIKPRVLSVRKNEEGAYVSEIVSFMSKIFHLNDEDVYIDTIDFAEMMSHKSEWAIDDSTLLIKKYEEEKYVALMTMKNIVFLNRAHVEEILLIDAKMVICESINLIPNSIGEAEWKEEMLTYKASGSAEMIKMSRIDELLSEARCCESQVTFVAYADNENDLNNNVSALSGILHSIGVQCIREDIALNSIFCSQICGNGMYAKRKFFNVIRNAATFALPRPRNIGHRNGSIWGAAIALFEDIQRKTPYYFNFHVQSRSQNKASSCHTLIIGNNDDRATSVSLSIFLAVQSTRNNANVMILDFEGIFDSMLGVLHANNVKFAMEDGIGLNITDMLLKLSDSELYSSLSAIIGYDLRAESEVRQFVHDIVDKAAAEFSTPRDIFVAASKMAEEMLEVQDGKMKTATQKLLKFLANEEMSRYFGRADMSALLSAVSNQNNLIASFDEVRGMSDTNGVFAAVLLHAIKSINEKSDAKLVLLVSGLDKLLSDDMIRTPLLEAIASLKFDNCVLISTIQSLENFTASSLPGEVMPMFGNQFIVNKQYLAKAQSKALQLNEGEVRAIRGNSRIERSFLFRNAEDALISRINDNFFE